jgi:hypothetical protein
MAGLNFDLWIESRDDGSRARVLDSPAGQAAADISISIDPADVERLLTPQSGTQSAAGIPDRLQRNRGYASRLELARTVGGELFKTIFKDEIEICLRRSLDEASRQDAALRIRLRLLDSADLLGVPWEFLYDPSRDRFLALSSRTPVLRYIEIPEPPAVLPANPPLNILVMISNPRGAEPLDVEAEWGRIEAALEALMANGLVQVQRLEHATLSSLQDQLRRSGYHILHFIGHGAYDKKNQAGVLLLEDESGGGQITEADKLGTVLRDHPQLRLVALNACRGAQTASTAPFSGVAQSLVRQGMPAVVAMQSAVHDQVAIRFSGALYAAVADGYPLDAAVGEARKAVFALEEGLEWGIPVLFMRSPDGILWDLSRDGEKSMTKEEARPWWDALPREVQGDVIVGDVSAAAEGVAIGKNIRQQIRKTLGVPGPGDRLTIDEEIAALRAELNQLAVQLDETTARMAEFQLELLKGELTKTDPGDTPSANTITQVGDWLLDNVPDIAELLAGFFATPAVGKVVGKAGGEAIAWARSRFSRAED